MEQNISDLLADQQHTVLELRKVCSNIVSLVMQAVGDSCASDCGVYTKVGKTKKRKKCIHCGTKDVMPTFLKISNLLLKLIPLEHQLYGVTFSKTLEHIKSMEDSNHDGNITEEDLMILQDFYKEHLAVKDVVEIRDKIWEK